MKEKEFNLSEKIAGEIYEGSLGEAMEMQDRGYTGYCDVIRIKDVKEFIKRLKEQAYIKSKGKPIFMMDDMYKLINQLAGDKLIGGKK